MKTFEGLYREIFALLPEGVQAQGHPHNALASALVAIVARRELALREEIKIKVNDYTRYCEGRVPWGLDL